jgi:hypothetical protein
LLEEFGDALATDACMAVDDDLAFAVDLGETLGHFVLRNQLPADLGDLVLPGLAHVEEVDVLAGIDAALQLLDGQLGDSVVH